jgi:hypothetical protein
VMRGVFKDKDTKVLGFVRSMTIGLFGDGFLIANDHLFIHCIC